MTGTSPSDSEPRKELILVVEDDPALREGLAMNLRLQGYEAVTAQDGETGMQKAFAEKPDLIVLDLMLPSFTGMDILEEFRKRGRNAPVLILSARDTTSDKVEGLKVGADDYMTKPFDLPELLARIEALLRRRRADTDTPAPLVFDNLRIDLAARRVEAYGRPIELSAREFDLLALLASSPRKPFTREAILERLWGWDYEGTARTVDNFVANLRKKLRGGRRAAPIISTVPRVGYRFDPG